ncbi:hypothetical protein SETIT_6G055300v2 [Setaria italica]|uniref:FAD-binding PCMH-type domain-containing protein n=1 Tax=Setaria italica TaxID=4555 RepID=K3YH14_SETIT|nr:reticuline oxidase [Setaria italica]RCV29953.1 hypothetical protein SETIT_6G055300v2 [Setaria italica]
MGSISIAALALLVPLFLSLHQTTCSAVGAGDDAARNLSSCLTSHGVTTFSLPSSPTYAALLNSSIRNLRFALPGVGKPAAVVLPSSKHGLRAAVLCARAAALAVRVRSGGHSYEGLSYTTENRVPFAVIDLAGLSRVRVDGGSATAWAEAGATLGELYHAVGTSSRTLAFPAGSCSTIGLGGIVSGGGFGLLSRKHGLAADNVLDAVLIDPSGNILTRDTMGDDVFWAIRGGGGGSWGVVYAWKLRLVPVPDTITVFTASRTGPVELVAGLVHRWQFVGPNLPDDFYLSVYLPTGGGSSPDSNVSVSFTGQVLGPKRRAMAALRRSFPELGLAASELAETSWLDATAQFAGLATAADLPDRRLGSKQYSKGKSDYVRSPIPLHTMAGIVRYLATGPPEGGCVILDPYGGAMARVGSGATPFPHRAGTLYGVQYQVYWDEDAGEAAPVGWLRSLHSFMAPHVSRAPRGAYVNYLDLDLGVNDWTVAAGGSSEAAVARARASWGAAYFGDNFDRLVRAKTAVDPGNVFNNAQSIPPLVNV